MTEDDGERIRDDSNGSTSTADAGRTRDDGSWSGPTGSPDDDPGGEGAGGEGAGGDGAGGEGAGDSGPDGDGIPNGVDPAVRDAVAEDLADLGDDELPSMEDPIDPQRIDAENAVFVTVGAMAMVGLVAHMIVGFF